MRVSVIIPTRDRPSATRALLDALPPELRDGDEVLVIDQSSPALTSLPPWVRHVVTPARGLAAARNLGAGLATAPVLLFLDDDTWPLPGLLDAHRAAFADPHVAVSAGRIIERHLRPNASGPRNDVDWSGRVRTALHRWGPGRVSTAKGANMALRRAAFAAVGGFDPGYGGTAFLEDADWSTRAAAAGWRVAWTPDAAVVHHSAPHGGCRAPPVDAERWRFRNTGRFLRRHRPWAALTATATFTTIALRRAWQWRAPAAPVALMSAFLEGLRQGGPPWSEPS